jgi:hypothetical protein
MYLDSLTLASLVVFVAALGAFIYACLYRGCINKSNDPR